ncbi:hypothetical protein PHBOTO_001549 [Pseudozyma hubeiensis]|nr:hypothetical protein PHBOTO_001549 [Pseudozyma hubeiensis]
MQLEYISTLYSLYRLLCDACVKWWSLELADEQVANHLSRGDPNSDTKGRQIERRAQHVRQTERQHGWDPTLSEFQRPAAILRHHVLLDGPTAKMVDRSGRVVFCLERASWESVLVPGQDVEVVVGGVTTSVTLGADGSAEEDEILRDRRVDDVHATHRTTGVVEHPLRFDAEVVLVDVRRELRVGTEVV